MLDSETPALSGIRMQFGSAQHHDNLGRPRESSRVTGYGKAIGAGHLRVDQQQIERSLFHFGNAFFAARNGPHVAPRRSTMALSIVPDFARSSAISTRTRSSNLAVAPSQAPKRPPEG